MNTTITAKEYAALNVNKLTVRRITNIRRDTNAIATGQMPTGHFEQMHGFIPKAFLKGGNKGRE